jgi:alpha-N-arabinofuranosidase
VLGHTAHLVDFVSCHAYYCLEDDLGSFLASSVDMDRFIETVVAIADAVCAERGVAHRISISFDEWNIWDVDRYVAEDKRTAVDDWPVAPRILEDVYSVADAVVLGSLLISLLKHADRVTSACLAQLVNVIAPIRTEPGGPAWTQTTYVPFATTSRLARGQALAVAVRCATYETAAYGEVPLVDAVATHDAATGAVALFLVNRATDASTTVEVDLTRTGVSRITETVAVWDEDLTAANTLAHPERVRARTDDTAHLDDGRVRIELPPVSWTALSLA